MSSQWVSFAELSALIGEDKAKVLCRIQGGVSLYVPKRGGADAQLAAVIGEQGLKLLAEVYGGESITVPNLRREPSKGAVLAMLDKGVSVRDIALELKVTERYVRVVGSQARAPQQGSLLD